MNTFVLKMIAVASMLIDHVGMVLFPQHMIFRIIGRIAFPIYAYTLVEGFMHTHDLKKYLLRMSALAFVSEIPYDLARTGKLVSLGHQNIFFSLTLGLIMLYLFVRISNSFERFCMVILFFLLSEFLRVDYKSMGLLMILCFYVFRDRKVLKTCSIAFVNIFLMGYLQAFGTLAMIPIHLHNRKEGPKAKIFFYAFYPVHLLLLFLIKRVL